MNFLDEAPQNKQAILFLHGLGTNATSWTPQIEPMIAAGYRPIIPDIPGFGASENLPEGWSLGNVSGHIAGALSRSGIKRATIVGLSMGGVIAQQIAIDHPDLVERLVLVSTFPSLTPDSVSQAIYLGRRFVINYFKGKDRQAGLVADRIFPDPSNKQLRDELEKQILEADPRAYRAATMALARFRLGDRLSNFDKPVMVIAGDRDSTVSVARQLSFKRYIPNCEAQVIKNAGHGLNIDQPDQFNAILLDFLGR